MDSIQQQSQKIMNDKDMAYDILQYQKYLLTNYTTMIYETADPKIRALAIKHLTEIFEDQFTFWKEMEALGFYKTKPAAPADITEGINKTKTMHGLLS